MSLKEPIVEGAWYLLEDNHIAGQALQYDASFDVTHFMATPSPPETPNA